MSLFLLSLRWDICVVFKLKMLLESCVLMEFTLRHLRGIFVIRIGIMQAFYVVFHKISTSVPPSRTLTRHTTHDTRHQAPDTWQPVLDT